MLALLLPATAVIATGLIATAPMVDIDRAVGVVGVAALRDDCTTSEPGVRVNVSGLRDRSGRLKLELYPATQADFLQDDQTLLKAGKVFRRIVVMVPAQAASVCVPVPRPGRYAVIVIHKRDGAPKFNVMNDGVALSGNSRIGRRKPTVDEATVVVADQVTAVDARMQYLRGFAGFKPIAR